MFLTVNAYISFLNKNAYVRVFSIGYDPKALRAIECCQNYETAAPDLMS
jgi:hypothetical protein